MCVNERLSLLESRKERGMECDKDRGDGEQAISRSETVDVVDNIVLSIW